MKKAVVFLALVLCFGATAPSYAARNFIVTSTDSVARAENIITAYPFTMACRIKYNGSNVAGTRFVMSIGRQSNVLWGLYVYDGQPIIYATDGSTSSEVGGTSVSYGVWYDYVLVFTSATDRKLYVNGTQDISATLSVTFTTTAVNRIAVGKNASVGFSSTAMDVADFGLWDVALNANEIAAFSAKEGPHLIRPASLKIYWPLYGTSGTSFEADLSGNKDSGTVTGATLSDHAPVGPYVIP